MPDHIPPPRQAVQRDLCGSAVGIPAGRSHRKGPRHRREALPHHDHRGNMRPAGPRNRPRGGAACFMWATFPNIAEAIKVMEAWGFTYKTAAFVWVKKNRKNGGNFMGMGAYTRANAEVCLLGVTPGFKAKTQIRAHNVHQIIEAPFEGHSKKPDETRRRIVELLGDVPRLEMFARQRADGWDAWGNEAPEA